MKIRKCPYCGKRISYISAYSSRRKAEYICERCGKESKVVISRKAILVFILFAVVSLAIMVGWIFAGLANNSLGIFLVAAPLIIYAIISPEFVSYQPLKKYRKSMEARKAGIEYSDNLVVSELEEADAPSFDTGQSFQIKSDIFNEIRAQRNEARAKLQEDRLVSDSSKIAVNPEKNSGSFTDKYGFDDSFVSVIKDVSENHSSADAPLRKIHSESTRTVSRERHYIPQQREEKSEKKSDGNRYSAQRKF